MFNAYKAFASMNGRTFAWEDYKEALRQVLLTNLQQLPGDVTIRDLHQALQSWGWVTELPGPSIKVHYEEAGRD